MTELGGVLIKCGNHLGKAIVAIHTVPFIPVFVY